MCLKNCHWKVLYVLQVSMKILVKSVLTVAFLAVSLAIAVECASASLEQANIVLQWWKNISWQPELGTMAWTVKDLLMFLPVILVLGVGLIVVVYGIIIGIVIIWAKKERKESLDWLKKIFKR